MAINIDQLVRAEQTPEHLRAAANALGAAIGHLQPTGLEEEVNLLREMADTIRHLSERLAFGFRMVRLASGLDEKV